MNPPAVYKRTGEVYCPPDEEYKGWNRDAVERIVKSRTYAGILEQGKTSLTARDERNRVKKPEEDWTVIRDAHEPLVSRETFSRAQEVHIKVQKMTAARRHPAQGVPIGENIFDKILYCGVCGKKMTRESHVKMSGDGNRTRRESYFCMDSGSSRKTGCPQINRISRLDLMSLLMPVLRMEFSVYLDKPGHFAESGKEQACALKMQTEQRIKEICNTKSRMSEKEADAYMDYREGRLQQKEYVSLKMKQEEQLQELEKQERELRERLDGMDKAAERYLRAVRSLVRLRDGNELNAETAEALIEKIYVYPGKRLEVQFAYENEILEGEA